MAIGPFSIDIPLLVKSITLTVMLAGLLVLPLLPGLVIIWVAALGYGLAAGFGTLGWIMFAILTLIVLVAVGLVFYLLGRTTREETVEEPAGPTTAPLEGGATGTAR